MYWESEVWGGGAEKVQRGWEELGKLILERKAIIFPEIFYLGIFLMAVSISTPGNTVYKSQSSLCYEFTQRTSNFL
jgi:hypothetical protein